MPIVDLNDLLSYYRCGTPCKAILMVDISNFRDLVTWGWYASVVTYYNLEEVDAVELHHHLLANSVYEVLNDPWQAYLEPPARPTEHDIQPTEHDIQPTEHDIKPSIVLNADDVDDIDRMIEDAMHTVDKAIAMVASSPEAPPPEPFPYDDDDENTGDGKVSMEDDDTVYLYTADLFVHKSTMQRVSDGNVTLYRFDMFPDTLWEDMDGEEERFEVSES
eukprot:767486-Hanusia_phi.AAC.2